MPIYSWNQKAWPESVVPDGYFPFRLFDCHGTEVMLDCCRVDTDTGLVHSYLKNSNGTPQEVDGELLCRVDRFDPPLRLVSVDGERDMPEVCGEPRLKKAIETCVYLKELNDAMSEMFWKSWSFPVPPRIEAVMNETVEEVTIGTSTEIVYGGIAGIICARKLIGASMCLCDKCVAPGPNGEESKFSEGLRKAQDYMIAARVVDVYPEPTTTTVPLACAGGCSGCHCDLCKDKFEAEAEAYLIKTLALLEQRDVQPDIVIGGDK